MTELERSIIRERVFSGLEHAQRNGTRFGKAVGRPRAIFDRGSVIEPREQGFSGRQTAQKLAVGVMTVRRACQESTGGIPFLSARHAAFTCTGNVAFAM